MSTIDASSTTEPLDEDAAFDVAFDAAFEVLSGHGYLAREKRCQCGQWRLDQRIATFPEPATPRAVDQWNRHLADVLVANGWRPVTEAAAAVTDAAWATAHDAIMDHRETHRWTEEERVGMSIAAGVVATLRNKTRG